MQTPHDTSVTLQETGTPDAQLAAGEPSSALSPRVRRAVLSAVTRTGLANLCRPLTRGGAVVFALHRFADPDRGVSGFNPDTLRTLLAFLRRKRYNLVDIHTAIRRLAAEGPPLRNAVAFTIDDGYREQVTIAGPVFAEFDCPVTTFVVTGFLDGDLWLWWDKIEYLLAHAGRRDVELEIGGARRRYALDEPAGAQSARVDLTSYCKTIADTDKHTAIRSLAAAIDVELPERPPAAYAPMRWDELRSAERHGMTFGPHTVTHPILSRTDVGQSRFEIQTSWTRLRAEARCPVPVFAYPNGQPGDFGAREIDILREIGFEGACTCTLAYATPRRFRALGPFQIPRFAPPDSIPYLIQFVTGLERLKLLLRGDDSAE